MPLGNQSGRLRMVDVIDAVVRALNERDVESFIACYAVDARIEDAAGEPLATGHDSIRRRYEEMFRLFPNLQVRRLTRLTAGAFVVQEEEVRGRSSQPQRHIAVYRIADGLIAYERLLR
jgi:hypothetical protein